MLDSVFENRTAAEARALPPIIAGNRENNIIFISIYVALNLEIVIWYALECRNACDLL